MIKDPIYFDYAASTPMRQEVSDYYSENYDFSIGISLNDNIYIVWNNFETGEEEFLDYSEDLTLEKIENWVIDCYKKHELYDAIA